MIKSVTTAACVLALTTTFAFAQAGGAPNQAPNSGAAQDTMKKDGMGKDNMGTSGTSGMSKDSMSKDGMKKDMSKDNKPVDGMKK